MEVSRDIAKFARSRPVIECAQCGERIYIPEWSECLDGSRVRHLWQCDMCGTSFETRCASLRRNIPFGRLFSRNFAQQAECRHAIVPP